MSYHKKTYLSSRSKRRRIEEELREISVSQSIHVHEIASTSNSIENVVETNLNPNDFVLPSLSPSIILDSDILRPSGSEFISPNSLYNTENNSSINSDLSDVSSGSSDEDYDTLLSNSDIKYNQVSFISSLIGEWAVQFKITHSALNGLLSVLKQHKCFELLCKDSRTLLHCKPINTSNLHTIGSGKYYNFGLANGIKQNVPKCLLNYEILHIVVGIDGLPLFKSSSEQFWPILAYIRSNNAVVFPIGIYSGAQKPLDSNHYLKFFVEEAKLLITNGI